MKTKKTLSQKILEKKAAGDLNPGAYVMLKVDVALGNDITAPIAIAEFMQAGGRRVFDPTQIVLVPDHFVPNKDIQSAEQVNVLRKFSRDQGIENFFELGRMGIEHVLLPEKGLVKSGDLVVGADSHTCTYGALGAFATGVGSSDLAGVFLTGRAWFKVPEAIKIEVTGQFQPYVSGKDLILKLIAMIGVEGANYKSLEFSGPGIRNISMDSRFTIANMAVEAGAKSGLFPVDDVTVAYEKSVGLQVEKMAADADAEYCREIKIELGNLEAQVAFPHLPSNCHNIAEAEKQKIPVDQVIIGSCTNGRLEDLRQAAAILKGRKVFANLRCIVIPGSQWVYQQAVREGLFDIFLQAECAISTPTCGPCLGGHMGILAAGEKAVATTNRNFVGRMGHMKSDVYLASPAVAAATAVAGYIAGPAVWEADYE